MRIFIVLSIFLCLSACQNNKENTLDTNLKTQDSLMVSKEDVAKINYIDFAIDSKAKSTLNNWEKHKELMQITKDLKVANFTFFKDNHENVIAFISDLKSTIPEKINKAPIDARLLIIETKLLKFESALKDTSRKSVVLSTLKEALEAITNLNFQINKTFEKEAQNIQKPL